MKKMFAALVLSLTVSGLALPLIFAQSGPAGDVHRKQMRGLMEQFINAKTDKQRKEIHEQIRQAKVQYRAANPPKELTPAEIEARRQKMEEKLRKDPYRWEMFQLRQSMGNAKTREEQESYRTKMQALMAKHAAEAEAKLTPEQRAEAQARQEKNVQMHVELKPLIEQLHTATTDESRKNIRARMREIFKKYR